ncbi:MAG: alpha/beta hydrolase fold domain-containing protein [Bacteroidales bacterium]|nr:alpha/beta hydrolase fold domain-containing protein [Bacteroidales bacterium]
MFLREGYDVVLLEYRVNNGITDVSDELADCAAALDYLTAHSQELNLNKDRMFLTGDSAGGPLHGRGFGRYLNAHPSEVLQDPGRDAQLSGL